MRLVTPITLKDIEYRDIIYIDGLIRIISQSDINNIVINIYKYQKEIE